MQKWKRKTGDENEVEAVQLTKDNAHEVAAWCNAGAQVEEIDALEPDKKYVGLNLTSWNGLTRASEGDYIIKDGLGTFHVRWPQNFEADFEKVGNDAQE